MDRSGLSTPTEDGRALSCQSFQIFETDDSLAPTECGPDDAVQLEMTKLRLENSLLRVEMEDRKGEVVRTDEPTLKTSLTGVWKIVGSENMKQFLNAHGASDLFNVVFQLADVHIQFNENTVAMFHQVGDKKYHEKSFELSRPQFFGNIACVSYICDDCLKTVYLRNGEENKEEIEKRLLREGRLHVVIRRYGVECIRIYEKINQDGKSGTERKAEEFDVIQKKYLDLTAVHEQLLEETGRVRKDKLNTMENSLMESLSLQNKTTTADDLVSNSVLCNAYEQLKSRLRKVYFEFYGNAATYRAQEKIEEIEKNDENLEARIEAIKKEVARAEEDPSFIRNSIVGKWQDFNDSSTFSIKVNNYVFIYDGEEYTFGVPDSDGYCFVIEYNTIVRKYYEDSNWRTEYFIENDQLVELNSDGNIRYVYNRIGDPK